MSELNYLMENKEFLSPKSKLYELYQLSSKVKISQNDSKANITYKKKSRNFSNFNRNKKMVFPFSN